MPHDSRALKQSKILFKTASANNIIDSPRRKSVSNLTSTFESDTARAKSKDCSDQNLDQKPMPRRSRGRRTDRSNSESRNQN